MTSRDCNLRKDVGSWARLWPISAFLFSIVVLLSGTRLVAQVPSGINGTVTDTSGAVIVGAQVSATDKSTDVVYHAVTSSAGTYVIVGLNPGHYSVAVTASGFKKSENANVVVDVAKMSATNFQMVPGATSTTVQVVGNAISLNTTSPTVGTTLAPELVKDAPLEINGMARQIDTFITLTPGAVSNSGDTQVGGNPGIHINGGVVYNSAVQFNGVPVNFVEYSGNQTNINPPYEMVNEFRVNSSSFDARYGLGQGVVTFSMASGANKWHGDGFEILRNQLFDSAGFFPTRFSSTGTPEAPIDQQNDYGFTVSGPVLLPKLYNGRNRTFFLFSWDHFKQNHAETGIGTVPTVAETQGDFSNFVDANGNQIPIYDPTTGQQFPNNKIDPSRFSALSKAILPFIPAPNTAGTVYGQQDNELPAVKSVPYTDNLWGYTLDEDLSSSQSIHFSMWRNSNSTPGFTSAPIFPVTNELQSGYSDTVLGSGFLVNYVKTVTPNLVATAGADWIGMNTGKLNNDSHASFAAVTNSTYFPLVEFDGQNAPSAWGVQSGHSQANVGGGLSQVSSRDLGLAAVNNWMWMKGRNTFNFGGEYRRGYQDAVNCNFCIGTFNFSHRTTDVPNSADPNFGSYGSAFASFLLGDVDAGLREYTSEQKMRNRAFSMYFQDDIKITRNLTASAGVRYDIMIPFTNLTNQVVYVNETEPNIDAGGLPGTPTQFGNCTGCSGVTRAAIDWKGWQPRLGFSYGLNNKTVIQSGFYVTRLDEGAYEFGTAEIASRESAILNGIYLRAATGNNQIAFGQWDSTPMPSPASATLFPGIANGKIIDKFDPNKSGISPYNEQWNAIVQRQLPWSMFLTVAYVGSRTIHMSTTNSLPNQPNPSVLQYGPLLADNILSPAAVAAGFTPPYPGFVNDLGGSATVEQALTPFPMFGGYYDSFEMDGSSFYNALQIQGEKRFSNNLSFMANLTTSTDMSNTETSSTQDAFNGVNAFNQRPEYAPDTANQRYQTHWLFTYALPVGLGQRYLNSRGPLAQVLGGWQVSGILTYTAGNPMGVQNNYNPLLVNGNDFPDVVPGVKMKTYSYDLTKQYFTGRLAAPPAQFSTNAFVNTGPWAIGDAKRSYAALTTPPYRMENFDAIKTFHVSEGVRISLRVDYFNAFNRTQFQVPDLDSSDSTFGEVTSRGSQISNRQGQATFRMEF